MSQSVTASAPTKAVLASPSLSEEDDEGPWPIHGVALKDGELTNGKYGAKLWPGDELEKAAPSLAGQTVTARQGINGIALSGALKDTEHGKRVPVGTITRSAWDPQRDVVVYDMDVEHEEIASALALGELEISIEAANPDEVDNDPKTGADILRGYEFVGMDVVEQGAAKSNHTAAGSAADNPAIAALSAEDVDDILDENDAEKAALDASIHDPSYSGTTESAASWADGSWGRPSKGQFDSDDLSDIGDHFIASLSGFSSPDSYSDLKLPVVEPNGDLNLNGLQAANNRVSQTSGLSDDEQSRARSKIQSLADSAFDEDLGSDSDSDSDSSANSAAAAASAESESESESEPESESESESESPESDDPVGGEASGEDEDGGGDEAGDEGVSTNHIADESSSNDSGTGVKSQGSSATNEEDMSESNADTDSDTDGTDDTDGENEQEQSQEEAQAQAQDQDQDPDTDQGQDQDGEDDSSSDSDGGETDDPDGGEVSDADAQDQSQPDAGSDGDGDADADADADADSATDTTNTNTDSTMADDQSTQTDGQNSNDGSAGADGDTGLDLDGRVVIDEERHDELKTKESALADVEDELETVKRERDNQAETIETVHNVYSAALSEAGPHSEEFYGEMDLDVLRKELQNTFDVESEEAALEESVNQSTPLPQTGDQSGESDGEGEAALEAEVTDLKDKRDRADQLDMEGMVEHYDSKIAALEEGN